MKSIHLKLKYYLIIIIMSLVLLKAYLFYSLYDHQELLLNAQNNRYKSYLIATQLRFSSDDLTRLVRTYVATNNPKFEKLFWKILAIRNGEEALPDHYDRVYWDFLAVKDGMSPFLVLPTKSGHANY